MKRHIALLLTMVLIVSVFGIFSGCDSWQAPGKVRFLNGVPEAREAWQKLAAMYSELNGVEVVVQTVTADDCEAALKEALESEDAPTGFQFHSAREFETLRSHCLDLTGTALLGQMTTGDFNLADSNGAVRAIGYSYEAYGIIVNKTLLEQAGYSLDAICDFATLEAAAKDIHSRSAELGFDAFASSGLAPSSAWRFASDLASVPLYYEFRDRGVFGRQTDVTGTYLKQYRQIWDLYIQNSAADNVFLSSATEHMSLEEFATGTAVFIQHNASAYEELAASPYSMDPGQLAMIPIYCGVEGEENAALCCNDKGYWAVNSAASEADRKATLDFLNWVVTSEYGISVLADHFGGLPFKAAGNHSAGFYATANTLIMQGKYALTGCTVDDQEWETALAAALAVYAADQTDENWTKVEKTFVENWGIDTAHS